MTIGNGFIVWYLILILFMLGFVFVPFFINRKKDKNYELDLLQAGLSRNAPVQVKQTTEAIDEKPVNNNE